jgi:hypothetical protein
LKALPFRTKYPPFKTDVLYQFDDQSAKKSQRLKMSCRKEKVILEMLLPKTNFIERQNLDGKTVGEVFFPKTDGGKPLLPSS